MNEEEIKRLFPNASKSCLAANQDCGGGGAAELERGDEGEQVGAGKGEGRNPAKYLLRFTCYRTRLLDPDNTCEKFHIDALRYAGVIPDDTPEDIILPPVQQIKVKTFKEERTEIEITEIEL